MIFCGNLALDNTYILHVAFLTMIKMQITGPQIIIFGYELISEIDKNQRYGVGFPKGQNNFFLLHNVHAEISAQKDSYAMATERSSVRGEAIGP